MKTFETEKHNIPEGATHYRDECEEYEFSWVKFASDFMYLWCETYWDKTADCIFECSVKPIPQTNIETPEEKEALDAIRDSSGFSDALDLSESAGFASKEIEWNGEDLPPVGAIYTVNPNYDVELLCKYSSKYVLVGEMLPKVDHKGVEVVIDLMEQRDRIFRKPETKQQREERERLEAAHDLYCHANSTQSKLSCTYSWFLGESMRNDRERFLAIVDKANYRKEG